MKILSRELKLPWFVPIVSILILIIAILLYWFIYTPDNNQKLSAILSGLITGFIAMVVQLLFAWEEQTKLKKYDELKIINILATRDNPEYYRPLIKNAKREIKILGVTCLRFLEDFVNDEPSAPENNKVLLEALRKKEIVVKILIADVNDLDNQADKNKFYAAIPRLERLKKSFPQQIFYFYYNHKPTHSIMIIDDQSIVGPIFPGVSSKFSPAIHLKNDSKFVEHYREYFNKEWAECTKSQQVS